MIENRSVAKLKVCHYGLFSLGKHKNRKKNVQICRHIGIKRLRRPVSLTHSVRKEIVCLGDSLDTKIKYEKETDRQHTVLTFTFLYSLLGEILEKLFPELGM